VIRDRAIAARFTGEITDLLRRYDPAFDATRWPAVEIALDAHCAATEWGDTLVLLGDLPELGRWSGEHAVTLDPSAWPTWRTTLTLPAGVRAEYKLAVRTASGALRWEQGENRHLTVPTGTAVTALAIAYRP
jgi:hypothetical protein